MNQTPPAPPTKYPPLTPAQQTQVLKYRKIAADLAKRLTASYRRLVDEDEAESIAMLTLCRAAQRYDPERAQSGIWPLAKLMIPQQIGLAIHVAMSRERGRISEAALRREEAVQSTPAEREALRVIIRWVGEDPTRAETIDRAVRGEAMSPADLNRLEELRDELGLLSPEAVDVATAAQRLGRSPASLRGALGKGTVPGYRCDDMTWRVFLGAALRCAAA